MTTAESTAAAEAPLVGRVNPDDVEIAAGYEHENLHGWVPQLAGEAELREALDKAFDYRGNITVTLQDGRKIEGYVFDRRSAATLAESTVRIIPVDSPAKVSVAYAAIRALEFTGKDTAAGKSFESWVAKYWAKKAAGETNIQIEPEALD
jgi:hypothetical protein